MIEFPVIAGLSMCSFGKGVFLALVVSLWVALLAFGISLTFGPEIGWGLDRIRRCLLTAFGFNPQQEIKGDWRDRPIDPAIKPLCDALNATGRASTIASCEGHFGYRYAHPYVYFSADPEFALAFETLIRASGLADGVARWKIEGSFSWPTDASPIRLNFRIHRLFAFPASENALASILTL